jgi:autotransporter passenger strand-loop-strand repeat protein
MTTTIVTTGVTSTGNTITAGNTLTVNAGGTEVSGLILSGGIANIFGVDSSTTIILGGTETVSGTAIGDLIGGTQLLAGGTVNNEIVSGGALLISGSDLGASGITITAGGSVQLQSAKAHITGTLSFSGAGTLAETAVVSSGTGGDLAVINGFGLGDAIDLTAIGSGAALSSATSGANTVLTVTGGSTETLGNTVFTLSGTGTAFTLVPDAGGTGSDIVLAAAVTTIASGQSAPAGDNIGSGSYLDVLSGGSAASALVLSGGTADFAGTDSSATIEAGGYDNLLTTGVEAGATVMAGGFETVLGTASGDAVFGTQLEAAASALVSNETLYNGGVLEMFATSGHAANITVESGGALLLSANAPVNNLVIQGGSVLLESKKSNIAGSIGFVGAGTITESSVISAGSGVLGLISGFGLGDVLDLSGIGAGATLNITSAGGNTVLSVSGGATEGAGVTESFTIAGTGDYFSFSADPSATGSEITLNPNVTVAGGQSTSSGYVVSGETLTVQAGGTATAVTVAAGGHAVISGSDSGSTIAFGGTETVFGGVSADIVYGTQIVSGAVSAETIATGGTVGILAGGTASSMVLDGGVLQLSGATATLTGGLTFAGAATLLESVLIATGYGDGAVISGFGSGDVVDLAAIGAGATLTSASVAGNTVITISGGSTEGSAVETLTFSGTGDLYALGPDVAGTGETLTANNPVITVAAGQSISGDIISAGYQLQVAASGTVTGTSILAGGSAVISGTESGSTIAFGGTETVFGASSFDVVSGAQLISGTAGNETIANGGAVTIAAGGTASNISLSGGLLDIAGSLTGGLTFSAGGTLVESGIVANNAVISGFTSGDVIDLANIGTGAFTSASTASGNTILTVSGGSNQGSAVETLTFSGTGDAYALNTDAAGTGETVTAIPMLTSFTSGDLVVGVIGDDNSSGYYGDNQAAPIALEEINPANGQIIGEMVLPEENSGANSAISGEYGSSSEGILQLAANGQSLVIAGYGVNAATFNNAPLSVYGNAALAQSTSLTDSSYTPVARVIADITYDGSVDTSTALYNIFNTNNPRSVATVDGQTFYISGQGVKGDTTQGVFVAQDGASAATAIDTATDTRTAEIYNAQLYVSQNSSSGTANIESFGGLPTGAATPTILPGINQTVLLTAAQANTINAGAVGSAVALSPEEYFFANATTLYVADGGQPKAGTIGDGGLQKWTLNTTTGVWSLDYTLSAGLNLVQNSSVSGDTSGTTGLIGLTGVLNANGTVTFYATNSTIADLDQTYLYTITDNVAATSAASGEQFTVVSTAASDTNDRGIALAPSAPVDTTIGAGITSAGLNVTTGSTLTVQAGGTVSGAVILSGGTALVSGQDNGSLVVLGGSETVTGSAAGDNVYGVQVVSGSVSDETVYYDGVVTMAGGASATFVTLQTGSELVVSASVSGLVISGGIAALAATTAAVSGVTFAGAGEIAELAASAGITGVISGFGVGDIIDLTQFGATAVLTSTVAGGNTVETVTSGGISQSITLAGQFASGALGLSPDASGGVEMALQGSTLTGTEAITAGQFGALITVASGATLTVDAGATVTQDVILSGGTAIIAGLASNDVIAGSESVATGATVSGETLTGGTLALANGAVAGGVTAGTGTIILEAGASLTGTLALGTDVTVDVANGASLGADIYGFSYADNIDLSGTALGATLTSSVVGGNTVETVTSGGISNNFTFAGTYSAGYIVLEQSASGDSLITKPPITNGFVVTSATTQGVLGGFYTGPTVSNGLVISSGFVLDELAGGTVTVPIVLNGGVADILGTESGAVVSSGGTVVVSAGGVENGATLLADGTETLIGLLSVTGDQVYGLQQVTNANSATGATLSGETVFNGGTVDLFYKTNLLENSSILAGGNFAISGNATGQDLTIAGGTITLESPKANLTGSLSFTAGGTLLETAVISSGFGDLATIAGFAAGDVIELTAIGAGAALTSATDAAGDVVVTIAGGSTESMAQTFTFTGTSEFSLLQIAGGAELLGDTQVISSGETASGGVISAGNEVLVLSGGLDSGSTILAGGSETVQAGGTVYITAAGNPGLILEAGSTEIVAAGVTVGSVPVAAGVTLIVDGTVSGSTISSGGSEIIASGGVDSGSTIAPGGSEAVLSGGKVYATPGNNSGVTLNSGSTEIVAGAITTSDAMVAAGATLIVSGIVDAGIVNSGGKMVVSAGGVASGTAIAAGGSEIVLAGGTTYLANGVTPGLMLNSGSTEIAGAGVSVSAAAVASGVTLDVLGTVGGTTVSKGGKMVISSGGVASGTTIITGGKETVLSGGATYITRNTTPGLTVSSGGTEIIGAGVTVNGAKPASGVNLDVLGTANASTVSSGGMEFIFSGGSVIRGKVLSGGVLTVSSGGVVSGGLTLSGGTAVIYGSVASNGPVRFDGSGAALEVGNSAFSSLISGFGAGNLIDFINLPYSAGASASFAEAKNNKSGVLTVIDGGHQMNLTLKGSYTTSNFVVSSGALGGTMVAFTSGGTAG